MRPLVLIFLTALVGCATLLSSDFDTRFGKSDPATFDRTRPKSEVYAESVRPLLERRCVVCHACYDAPCQLKLGSFEGITRGASKDAVYRAERLLAAEPTRLFEDASTVAEWRKKNFFAVLNERDNSQEANIEGSVLAQMLLLKQAQPLPDHNAVLPDSFDLQLNRKQQCPSIESFEEYKQKYPLWGMPYALPGLQHNEQKILLDWVQAGAPASSEATIPLPLQVQIDEWEALLNQDSLKAQLSSRYIYEHLFLAHLWFEPYQEKYFFQLLRSSTAPGQPIKRIVTRSPLEDPKVARVYYRIEPVREAISAKTHMPYAMNAERKTLWKALFFEADFEVTRLPTYDKDIASNPFLAFRDLPLPSRYRFMLAEAEFTIMGFIKGPVCRGQTALNVINDFFWVTFADPDLDVSKEETDFLAEIMPSMSLPASDSATSSPLNWISYARQEKRYLEAKTKVLNETIMPKLKLDLDLLWDGDGNNSNAALTIYRHFDSATVVKGLQGERPQTAWIITYPLLERIHYLLVAGYDVYGNVGHQLNSRIYMDFLRMEGEYNFLALLPRGVRTEVRSQWYRGSTGHIENYLNDRDVDFTAQSDVVYHSDNKLDELYALTKQKLRKINTTRYQLDKGPYDKALLKTLQGIDQLEGRATSFLPETLFIELRGNNNDELSYFTLLHHSAHLNIAHIFGDEKRRVEDEDRVSLLRGLVGAYPVAFVSIAQEDLAEFKDLLEKLNSELDYAHLLDRFGVRRSNPQFWALSDRMHDAAKQEEPIEYGLFDFNRLENR